MKKTYYLLFIAIFTLLLSQNSFAEGKVQYDEIPLTEKKIEIIGVPIFFGGQERAFRFEYKNEVCNISVYKISCHLNGTPSTFSSKEKNASLIEVWVYGYVNGRLRKNFVTNMERWEHKGEVCYKYKTLYVKNFDISCFKK